jgi:ribosomal protein L37AE/L43A
MKCPECGSGDISFFRIVNKVEIWRCNTCGEEFANVD